jgi:type I restriction enzyme S subunit
MSELYSLPNGWEWKSLNEVFIVKDGTHDSPKYIEENGYPLLTSKNLRENGLDYSNFKLISEEDYIKINQRSKVDKGDLLFAMIGTIGNPTIIEQEPNFAIKNVALFKPMNKENKIEFLRYYFLSNFVIDKMINEANGATQKFVGLTYLRNFLYPQPPLEEQKRIVAKLDILFKKIDKAIALHQKNIDEVNVFMASVLNDVFLELEEKYEKKELSNLVSKLGDGLHGTPKYDDNGEYYFINGANVKDNKIIVNQNTKKVNEDEYNKYKKELNDRTIFVSINGTIGNVGLYNNEKCILGKSACYFNLLENIDKIYITYVLKNGDFQEYIEKNSTGATIKNVSLKTMRAYKIPLPPLPTQQKVVAYLDEISNKMEKIKQIQKEKMQSLKALKASILDQAFKGEL